MRATFAKSIREIYSQAEKVALTDPASSVVKCRIIVEKICEEIGVSAGVNRIIGENLGEYAGRLARHQLVSEKATKLMQDVRLSGNKGAHDGQISPQHAKISVRKCQSIIDELVTKKSKLPWEK